MRGNAAALGVFAAGALAVLLTAWHLRVMFRDLRDAHQTLETQQSLRRLAALTIRNFPGRDLDSAELFWKSIGREGNPMFDFWGTEFRLTSRDAGAQRTYFWASAGPDATFGTRDDVVVEVPYPSGPGSLPELGPGEDEVPKPINTDAR